MSQSVENGHSAGDKSCNGLHIDTVACKSIESQNGAHNSKHHHQQQQGLSIDRGNLVQITFEMSIMKPFEEQVAGHGLVDGSILLKHPDGRVLKPQQAPPKGTRELAFYQNMVNPTDPDDLMISRVVPQFYGLAKNERGDEFLVLKDITQGMSQPTVIDVKIGSQTWLPDATEAKKTKESKKYLGTRPNLGFSVSGMLVHRLSGDASGGDASDQLMRLDKQFGMKLKAEDVKDIPHLFFDVKRSGPVRRELVETVIAKMHDALKVFEAQRKYNFFSSSLLMAYDACAVRNMHLSSGNNTGQTTKEQKLENNVNVSIIDFANVVICQDKDENFVHGMNNLIQIFEGILSSPAVTNAN